MTNTEDRKMMGAGTFACQSAIFTPDFSQPSSNLAEIISASSTPLNSSITLSWILPAAFSVAFPAAV